AAVRHVLLAAAFGALLLLPVASLVVPPVRIAVPTIRTSSTAFSAPAVDGRGIVLFTTTGVHSEERSTASRSSMPPVAALLCIGWLAGSTLAIVPLFASWWKMRRLRRSVLPWADGRKASDRVSLESDFGRPVEVMLHEALPGPIASGMLHPAILFPLDAQTW